MDLDLISTNWFQIAVHSVPDYIVPTSVHYTVKTHISVLNIEYTVYLDISVPIISTQCTHHQYRVSRHQCIQDQYTVYLDIGVLNISTNYTGLSA